MFLSLNRLGKTYSILIGTKYDGAITYAWYYQNNKIYQPGLTDSYREFWL